MLLTKERKETRIDIINRATELSINPTKCNYLLILILSAPYSNNLHTLMISMGLLHALMTGVV
jgi:hypothetical protein